MRNDTFILPTSTKVGTLCTIFWPTYTTGMCVIFYFVSRYMRPEGPWQRLRRSGNNGGGVSMDILPLPRPALPVLGPNRGKRQRKVTKRGMAIFYASPLRLPHRVRRDSWWYPSNSGLGRRRCASRHNDATRRIPGDNLSRELPYMEPILEAYLTLCLRTLVEDVSAVDFCSS